MAKRTKKEDQDANEVEKSKATKTTTKKTAAKKTTEKKAVDKKVSSTAKKSISATNKSKDKEIIKPSEVVPSENYDFAVAKTVANIPKSKKSEQVEEPSPSSPRVSNVRYSDEELEEFGNNIKLAKEEAIDELRMLRERLDDLTSPDMAEESMVYSMHMAEQGSEAMEKEKTYAQIQRINEYLKKLDDAMVRIKDKTYGICRVCGCLINRERLFAVPITTLSASYKIHQKCPEDGIDKIEPLKDLS